MDQIGCVLVFKPGVDPNEVIKKLKALEDVVDLNYNMTPGHYEKWYPGKPQKHLVLSSDRRSTVAALHKFNPEHGGPVWYIP
jgi:hypothetical protein